MDRGEFVSEGVLHCIGTGLDVDFVDMVWIIK